MSIDGNWQVNMSTPMGDRKADVTLKTDGSLLTGKVVSDLGEEEITDGKVDGNTIEWEMGISKPMPMTLKFKATIDGDAINGTVGLGMFGNAELTGHRV